MKDINKEIKYINELKVECHNLINQKCKTQDDIRRLYCRLTRRLKMKPENCHISLMDVKYLRKTLKLLKENRV